MKDTLKQSIIYKSFESHLQSQLGAQAAQAVWAQANTRHAALINAYADLDGDSRMMLLPALALYEALQAHCGKEQALSMLIEYGKKTGERIASLVHALTSIPGVPSLLWRNMPRMMRHMSRADKGYARRIVSESRELVGVDILVCPLHQAAIRMGTPEIARVVCAMDKAYMSGFRHIRYTRTTSVAEGDECCDYRLSFDKSKE